MNVIIHDLTDLQFQQIFPQITGDTRIVSNKGSIRNCIGCFGCWIKTPGQCVMKDGYENMGSILSQADTVTIISKCYYGGYSPFVKNVLDRSIPFLLPFFKMIDNETHHIKNHSNFPYIFMVNILLHRKKIPLKIWLAGTASISMHQSITLLFSIP